MNEDIDNYGKPLKGLNTQEGRLRELQAKGYDTSYEVPAGTTYTQYYKKQLMETDPIQEIGFVGIGDDRRDKQITSATQLDDLANTRGQLQSGVSKIANGLAKGAILAGTTFLDGTVGLVIGGTTALAEDRLSGLWDNDFSKAMKSVNDWSEKALPNNYTNTEQERPWYQNIASANFIGDKFLKNIGFTVGAFYSGAVWSKPLTQIGKLSKLISTVGQTTKAPALVSSSLGATISAVNEGRIEALNNSTQWGELQTQKAEDNYKDNVSSIIQRYGDGQLSMKLINDATTDYEDNLAQIAEDQTKVGNADMLMNLPILLASNIVQFGKLYSGGFKTARKANGIVKKATGEYAREINKAPKIAKAILNPLSEGSEEVAQQIASTVSGVQYENKLDNFYKAKIDPNAEQKTVNWIKSFAQGVNETVNEGSTWEQFFIGSLTGAMGMPVFGKANTKEAYLGKNKSFGLSGGILGELQEADETKDRDTEIVDYMNERTQSPEFKNYYQGLIRHNKFQLDMDDAIENGDEFSFKNAEHSQFASDIMMFDNAGKLGDLTDMINSTIDTSDENLESIVKNTSSTIKDATGKEVLVGPFIDESGNPSYSTAQGKQDMIDRITNTANSMQSTIDNYLKAKKDIDTHTNGQLSDDQLTELTWLKTQINDWNTRSEGIANSSKEHINKISNKLTEYLQEIEFNKEIEAINVGTESDKYLKLEEKEKEISALNQGLQGLAQRSSGVLSTILGSSEVKDTITRISSQMVNNGTVSLDEAELFYRGLNDLGKIQEAKETFSKRLNYYYTNPNKLAEDLSNSEQIVMNNEADKITDTIKDINNVQDLRKILNSNDRRLNPRILENLNNSTDFNLKMVAEEYGKLQEAQRILKGIFQNEKTDQAESEAVKILNDAFENAGGLTEFENIVNSVSTNGNLNWETKSALDAAMIQYNDSKKSKAIDKKDTNKPQGAVKKTPAPTSPPKPQLSAPAQNVKTKGGIGSIFDKLSNEVNQMDAGLKEDMENAETQQQPTEISQQTPPITNKVEIPTSGFNRFYSTPDNNSVFNKNFETTSPEPTSFYVMDKDGNTTLRLDNQYPKTAIDNLNGYITPVFDVDNIQSKDTANGFIVKERAKVDKDGKVIKKGRVELTSTFGFFEGLESKAPTVVVAPVIFTEGGNESESNAETNSTPSSQDIEGSGSLRSWTETLYDFNALKDQKSRKIVRRNNPTVNALDRLGAYSFVDNGKLGKLINRKPDTKIYYVLSQESGLNNSILLAIELTPEVLKVVKNAENPITIDGKTYQIIGTLGYNGKNKTSVLNHQGIEDALRAESSNVTTPYFVSQKFYNKIKHFYSGRMVKSSSNEGVSNKEVNEDFLRRNNIEFNLGFFYKNDDFRTPTIDQSVEYVVPLNVNNRNPRQGSVWLMTQEADGRWYAKAIQVKRFSKQEYPLGEHLDSPILKELTKNLKDFVDPKKSDSQRLQARDIIESILYFPSIGENGFEHSLLYQEVKDEKDNVVDVIVSIKGVENNIASGKTVNEKALTVLQLLQDDSLNLRFQISPSQMDSKTSRDNLLKSGILITDLYQPLNVNASFDLYLNDLETGVPIEDSQEFAFTGHTGRRGINSSLSKSTVYHAGNKYFIYEDDTVTDDKNTTITNDKKLSEIELSRQILTKQINPLTNTRVYLGHYKDGTEFGILGKRVLTKNELNRYKIESATATKNQNKKESVSNLVGTIKGTTETTKEETNKSILDKVSEKIKKNAEPPAKTGRPPLIVEDFNSTVLRQTPETNEVTDMTQFLKQDFNRELKNKLFEKLQVDNINDALVKIDNISNLPDIETLKTPEQFASLIKTIIECR